MSASHGNPSAALKRGYDNFSALMIDSSHSLVAVLQRALSSTEYNTLASALVDVFDHHGRLMELFEYLISTEVAATTSAGTLFRNNSLASKSMSCVSNFAESRDFLNNTLGVVVREISSGSYGSLEIDPAVAPVGADVNANLQKLNSLAQRVLDSILASCSGCTPMLRQMCTMLKSYCSQKFPESSLTSVGGLINLRFFCPAIVTPENYGLVGDGPAVEARRILVLMSKIIQNLSNHVAFREGFMSVLNSFLTTNQARMDSFLDSISTPQEGAAPTVSQPHVQQDKYYEAVHTLGVYTQRVKAVLMMQLPITDAAKKKEFFDKVVAALSEIQAAGDPLTKDSGASGAKDKAADQKSAKEKAKLLKEEKKRQEQKQKELEKKQKQLQKMEKDASRGHFFEDLIKTRSELREQALLIAGEQMCAAADDGNVAVIEEWVTRDKKYVNAKDPEGQTVLHHACTNGHLNVVRYLLHEKADCYLSDRSNWTALHCAAVEGHLDIVVELCMYRRIDVCATNDDENTPLHYLARIPYTPVMESILKLFLAGGADVNARNTNNETPLHMAVWKSNVGMVRLLLQYKADPNARNVKGSSPWDWAKSAQNSELIALFESVATPATDVPPGSCPSGPDPIPAKPSLEVARPPQQPGAPGGLSVQTTGVSTISPASTHSPTSTTVRPTGTTLLPPHMRSWRAVRPKGNMQSGDFASRSKALWDAIRSNSESTVRMLVHEDHSLADNTYGSNRNTVLHAAVPYGNVSIIKLLLRSVSKIEKNESGVDPLMSALWQGSEEVVLVFLLSHHKIDVNSHFEDGNTHLHQAALLTGDRADAIIFALVERGADVNSLNPHKDTPLHLAVRAKNTKAVRSLLDCGAKVSIANDQGETPLDLAKKNSLSTIIPMLEEAAVTEKEIPARNGGSPPTPHSAGSSFSSLPFGSAANQTPPPAHPVPAMPMAAPPQDDGYDIPPPPPPSQPSPPPGTLPLTYLPLGGAPGVTSSPPRQSGSPSVPNHAQFTTVSPPQPDLPPVIPPAYNSVQSQQPIPPPPVQQQPQYDTSLNDLDDYEPAHFQVQQ